MEGILPPLHRSLLLYLLLFLTLRAFQPVGMFYPDGRPRALGSDDGETLFPAWFAASAFALLL